METKNEILQELQAISSVLASIPKKNCFKMPANYWQENFEQNKASTFAVEKLSKLKKNAFVIPQNLNTNEIVDEVKAQVYLTTFASNKNLFTVPKNYFTTLSEKLSFVGKKEIENVSLPKANYKVPQNYFTNLTDSILTKVKSQDEELNPLFKQMQGEQIFNVPKNYFNNLTEEVILANDSVTTIEKIETIAGKQNSFKTPIAYFDGLYSRLNRKIKQDLKPKRKRSLVQIASIASLCLIFALGLLFTNNLQNNGNFESQIATLSADEIEQFITENESEFNDFLFTEYDENDYNFDILENAEITDEDIEQFLFDVDETFINSL